ncbi:hypothetical protein BGZ79_004826, partial [Entomortierella chlamydospora]
MAIISKVETYGRRSTEDIRCFPIALAVSELYVVRVVENDGCNKLVIGIYHWDALVTASIDLASGEPLVGPLVPAHYIFGMTSNETRVWNAKSDQ